MPSPTSLSVSLAVAGLLVSAAPARAQRFTFERTFPAAQTGTLDVQTVRGKITVTGTDADRLIVRGTVTVRVGPRVPANAIDLARTLAADPPIASQGSTLRLRAPSDPMARRAVTLSYDVQLPRHTRVEAVSQSGAVSIEGVAQPVRVRTQSSTITLAALGSTADVTTGSGAVEADGIADALGVQTASSSIAAHNVGGALDVRTNSGSVDAILTGAAGATVRTHSSAVVLQGVRGGLNVTTESGHVRVGGTPGRPWTIATGSGAVDLDLGPDTAITVDARSRSGSVVAEDVHATEPATKRRIVGTVNGGGARVGITSRSGSIRIRVADQPPLR